jgi:GNAT superfamily N-acetyltransferase
MVVMRPAKPADGTTVATTLSSAFESYRAWAPREWSPPVLSAADIARLAEALARSDVWCVLALDADEVIGHVALSLFSMEDREPPPTGTINLWQLFVKPAWHGQGVATLLIDAAVAEARRRGFTRMRLWTPQGAGRARRFYEREGWRPTGNVHKTRHSGCRRSNTLGMYLPRARDRRPVACDPPKRDSRAVVPVLPDRSQTSGPAVG